MGLHGVLSGAQDAVSVAEVAGYGRRRGVHVLGWFGLQTIELMCLHRFWPIRRRFPYGVGEILLALLVSGGYLAPSARAGGCNM